MRCKSKIRISLKRSELKTHWQLPPTGVYEEDGTVISDQQRILHLQLITINHRSPEVFVCLHRLPKRPTQPIVLPRIIADSNQQKFVCRIGFKWVHVQFGI